MRCRVKWKLLAVLGGSFVLASMLVVLAFSGSKFPTTFSTIAPPLSIQTVSDPQQVLRAVHHTLHRLPGFSVLDCDGLLEIKPQAKLINKAANWSYDENRDPIWKSIDNATDQCAAVHAAFVFLNESLSPEEAAFPIAYGILVHKSITQIYYMMSAIYHPQNVYVVSVDGKASVLFKKRISLLSDCFSNIFVVHTNNVPWCGYEIVRSVFNSVRLLSSLRHSWRYFQYLSGVDLPLKTNLEMVRIFKELKGAFISEVSSFQKFRLGKIPATSPLPLFKSSLSATFSREAADFMVKDREVHKLLDFLKLTKCPDESIWATIAGNPDKIPIPGGFNGTQLLAAKNAAKKGLRARRSVWSTLPDGTFHPEQFYISRFQVWKPSTRCLGKFVSSSCVFGVRDLPMLAGRPELVVHKLYMNFQPATYFCLLQHHWKRALNLERQNTFNAHAYGHIAQVEALQGIPAEKLHFYYSE